MANRNGEKMPICSQGESWRGDHRDNTKSAFAVITAMQAMLTRIAVDTGLPPDQAVRDRRAMPYLPKFFSRSSRSGPRPGLLVRSNCRPSTVPR